MMQVYHFLNARYGLAAIAQKRLKISRLDELNDPFELLGVSLAERHFRRAFVKLKEEFVRTKGILCFSKGWQNPVLWSHYADRHRGMCLGFVVCDEHLFPINYVADRLAIDDTWLKQARIEREKDILRFLSIKFEHWKYEDEVRSFMELEEKDEKTGLYFKGFSDSLRLNKVILGANTTANRKEVLAALGGCSDGVEIFKGRAAFRTFEVVEDLSWSRRG